LRGGRRRRWHVIVADDKEGRDVTTAVSTTTNTGTTQQPKQEFYLQQRRRQRKFAILTTTKTKTLVTVPRDSVSVASASVKSLSTTGITAQQQRKQHITEMQNTYTQIHIRLKQKLTSSTTSSSIIARYDANHNDK